MQLSIIKNVFIFSLVALICNVARAEYDDAQRDRPRILTAATQNRIEMSNLKFPLSKQLFTAPLSALMKIPELIESLSGGNDGFLTMHTITFETHGKPFTCVANVLLKPDNKWFVSVDSCGGKDGTKLWTTSGARLFDWTQAN